MINGSKQYMTICIEEKRVHDDTNCIIMEGVEMKQYIYQFKSYEE